MTDGQSNTHHGSATDGGMNISPHDGDAVREAVNRAEYTDHKAFGVVDGHEVLVHARVTEQNLSGGFYPKMTVFVGGEYDRAEDIYLSGSTVTERFDTLWELDEVFEQVVVEHDLKLVEGVGADD